MEYADFPTFEIKSLDDSGAIEGLLAGFGDTDFGGDKLLPGCLSGSLKSRSTPLPMLLCHRVDRPIGSWTRWKEYPDGLFVSGKMTLAVRDAQEAHALAKDGGLRGLSIGWTPKRTAPGDDGERLVVEAELHEGSLVPCPMHPRATVTAIKGFSAARDIADLLEAAGLSGRKARVAAGAAWKAINQQSEGELDDADEAKAVAIVKASIARINSIRRVGQ